MKKRRVVAIGIVTLFLAGCGAAASNPPSSSGSSSSGSTTIQWGHQSKTLGCAGIGNGKLPDPACTPGDVLNVTKDQVCTPGYSSSVRNVPTSEKDQVYAEYGIASRTTGEYEVDHFVSLELGGSNDISNLWPEPANPTPGFHQKDTVENYLHSQVCNGSMTLQQAQVAIATNWLTVYNSIPHN